MVVWFSAARSRWRGPAPRPDLPMRSCRGRGLSARAGAAGDSCGGCRRRCARQHVAHRIAPAPAQPSEFRRERRRLSQTRISGAHGSRQAVISASAEIARVNERDVRSNATAGCDRLSQTSTDRPANARNFGVSMGCGICMRIGRVCRPAGQARHACTRSSRRKSVDPGTWLSSLTCNREAVQARRTSF